MRQILIVLVAGDFEQLVFLPVQRKSDRPGSRVHERVRHGRLVVNRIRVDRREPFDDLLGVCAGVTGNPAILAAASRLAPTDRPDVGYAISYPSATIVKIIAVQTLLR